MTRPVTSVDRQAWWRGLRRTPGLLAIVIVVAFLTSTFVAAAPRSLDEAAADDLRAAFDEATPEQRNLRFELRSRIGAGSTVDPFDHVDRRGELLFERGVPPTIADLVTSDQYVVDSPRFRVSSFPDQVAGPFPTTFSFRSQEGIDDHLTVVEGRMPEAREPFVEVEGEECPDDLDLEVAGLPGNELDPEIDCRIERVPVYETALTAATARDMMVEVGDTVTLVPDELDGRWRAADPDQFRRRLLLVVSGIVELSDPTLEFWYADSSLHRPRVTENPDFRIVAGVGLLRPDRYRQLLGDVPNVTNLHTWRYFVDHDAVPADRLAEVATDLEKIAPEGVEVVTQLPELIDGHLDQRATTVGLLSTTAFGLLATAVAAMVTLTLVLATRRGPISQLVLDRGASRSQLLTDAVRTGVAAIAPASAAGWLAAFAWWPDSNHRLPSVAVVVFALSAVLVFAATALPPSRASRSSARRLVAEVTVVAAAVGSVIALRRRGGIVDPDPDRDIDLLLAAGPALLAVAIGLGAVRLHRPLMSVGARLAARRPTLAAFVGFRRVTTQPVTHRLPLLAVVMAVVMSVFSAGVGSSLADLRSDAAWFEIGADQRVETTNAGVPLLLGDDGVASVAGDRPAAAGVSIALVPVIGPDDGVRADVVATDADSHRQLLAGSGLDLRPLERLASFSGTGPIPAVVSSRWTGTPLAVGDQISLVVGAHGPALEVVAVVDRFPGADDLRPFVVVDRAALQVATDDRTVQPTFVLVGGEEPVELAIAGARSTARADVLATIADDPFSSWSRWVLFALFGLAAGFAVLGTMSAPSLTAAVRRRELGVLRTLGSTMRDSAAVTAIEQLPTLLIGTIVGAAGGVATVRILDPALDLGGLVEAAPPGTEIAPDLDGLVTALAVIVIAVVVAIGLSLAAQRRVEAGTILRGGDDP